MASEFDQRLRQDVSLQQTGAVSDSLGFDTNKPHSKKMRAKTSHLFCDLMGVAMLFPTHDPVCAEGFLPDAFTPASKELSVSGEGRLLWNGQPSKNTFTIGKDVVARFPEYECEDGGLSAIKEVRLSSQGHVRRVYTHRPDKCVPLLTSGYTTHFRTHTGSVSENSVSEQSPGSEGSGSPGVVTGEEENNEEASQEAVEEETDEEVSQEAVEEETAEQATGEQQETVEEGRSQGAVTGEVDFSRAAMKVGASFLKLFTQ